jgi:hypothetical protein
MRSGGWRSPRDYVALLAMLPKLWGSLRANANANPTLAHIATSTTRD